MLKKILLPLAVIVICFMINPILGAVSTVVVGVFAAYYYLPNIYAIQGNKAYAAGNLSKAEGWYNKAIATGRANDELKIAYSILLMRSGKPIEAERYLDEIARKKVVKPEIKQQAKQYRCMAYCKQGRMDEAMEDAREIFEVTKNTITYGIMGYFMLLTNAPLDETIMLCEEACDYNSDDRDILDNMALAYYRAGNLDKAKKYTDKLTEEFPTFVEAFYHGALVEKALGNIEKAREYISKIPECKRTYMTTVPEEDVELLTNELA